MKGFVKIVILTILVPKIPLKISDLSSTGVGRLTDFWSKSGILIKMVKIAYFVNSGKLVIPVEAIFQGSSQNGLILKK